MKETILVVDDAPTNVQLVVGFLASSGYITTVAENGALALESLRQSPPDLVLLDVAMPGMDGFETCHRIKEEPTMRDVPVLFLTGRAQIDDKLKGFKAGGVDYIAKPIHKAELLARVDAHLTILRQKRQLHDMLEQRQRFMRIAAHDLRNPLAVVLASADLGLYYTDVEGKQSSLKRIRDAGLSMKAIIDDFLALRILERAIGEEMEVFELDGVVMQVLELAQASAQSKSIGLAHQFPAGTIYASGNMAHTHQIVTNYVSNAVKYSPPGTSVQVSLHALPGHWRLEVKDQGPGIPPAERQHLFVEFARISNKPTGGETSTGLGLSIVKSLAQAQHARVGAEFPPEGGSCFWLEIPATASVHPAKAGLVLQAG